MINLPLSLVAPVRVAADTPQGMFYPYKPVGIVMLSLSWGGKPYLLQLTGEHAFKFFAVSAGYSARGTLVTDIEINVDLSSQYDAVQMEDPPGALVLQDGKAFVVATNAAEQFSDPVEVPLGLPCASGSNEEKVGYSRWSICARNGDKRVSLWALTEKGAVTE